MMVPMVCRASSDNCRGTAVDTLLAEEPATNLPIRSAIGPSEQGDCPSALGAGPGLRSNARGIV